MKMKDCIGADGKNCSDKAQVEDRANCKRCSKCRQIQRLHTAKIYDMQRKERRQKGLSPKDGHHRDNAEARAAREELKDIPAAIVTQANRWRQIQQVQNLCF